MFTLEQKIDICLEWIASDDMTRMAELEEKAREALELPQDDVPANVDVDDMIYELFKKLGMRPNIIGYKYAFTAVKLVIADPSYLQGITKCLYPDIASEYNTTASRVERAIRTVVCEVFDRCCDYEQLTDILGNIISMKNYRITNSEFIAACANEIERRMKKVR